MNQTKLRNYAEILVKRGLNVKKGQGIYLECPAEGAAFAAMIVEEAAKARAGRVIVKLKDEAVEQALLKQGYADLSGEEMKLLEDCAKSGAAFLRIETINVGTNLELSADLLSRKAKALRNERVQYQKLSGGVQTCIADFPTKAWTRYLRVELPEEEGMKSSGMMYLPVRALIRKNQLKRGIGTYPTPKKRKELLNQKNFKRIRYTGPGTDLTAELHKNGKWQGGNMQLADGTIYVPNIPTEEIFHAPTCDSAEGVVAATFPLNVEGVLVKDMQLEFRGGKVIRARASEGEEVLLKLLSTDEGAARLGEVALIDQDSSIASMKKIFYSSLYDENASCHMAIGLAAGPKPSTDEKMREERLNLSSIHVDFMVGSDQLSVYGENGDGKWEPILENGRFAGEYRF